MSCSLIGKTPFFGSGLYQFKSGQLRTWRRGGWWRGLRHLAPATASPRGECPATAPLLASQLSSLARLWPPLVGPAPRHVLWTGAEPWPARLASGVAGGGWGGEAARRRGGEAARQQPSLPLKGPGRFNVKFIIIKFYKLKILCNINYIIFQ